LLIEENLSTIRGYLHKQHGESFVRYALFNQHLPEYLMTLSQQLIKSDSYDNHEEEKWQELAKMIWTWQQCPAADTSLANPDSFKQYGQYLHHDGWQLFYLAQHLGLAGSTIRQLTTSQLETIFESIHSIDKDKAGFILLQAYERHYRDEVFTAISQNQGRGTWANRESRPEAQVFFCMDDREEGFRRHLEHHNPSIETFGAAAFFGVVMKWKSVEKEEAVTLCPIVATPIHEIQEFADENHKSQVEKYLKRHTFRTYIRDFIHQDSHRSLIRTSLLIVIYAPIALLTLSGKVFTPLGWNGMTSILKENFDTKKVTRIKTTVSAQEARTKATQKQRQHGYTLEEQTNIVESFLQNNGLLSGFAPLIVTMGHYSHNQNNPHIAAYGCGACGGKFSGPNGRVLAAMANHPEVRVMLTERGIFIPEDSWFIGAEHDSCNENIEFSDMDLIPAKLNNQFKKLQSGLNNASQHSAHERCRKLASAPKNPTLSNAAKHIAGRGVDFSQARPELGHATIACGFVGRRYLSQGTFLDRRSFLISYDPNVDPKGVFLERILLSAGPVGAGINLEYYFSAVNNEQYGCGSKIVHNLSGLFGVMEGGSGDLRTGLPLQMIEVHEPMRLQLMVEANTEILTAIYQRQESIQQLVGNGWLLLSAKDPDSEAIHTFDPEKGWELWKSTDITIPTVNKSEDWYKDHYEHLSPALIRTQDEVTHA